mgnify:CR=1 FL=1
MNIMQSRMEMRRQRMVNGCRGPGMDLFLKMKETLGDLPIIAEDLGS